MILKPFYEIVGTLTEVVAKEEYVTLIFTIEKKVEIPSAAILLTQLGGVKGKHIGLFNNSGEYKIRIIKKLKEEKEDDKERKRRNTKGRSLV